jgi:hypothetical protein
MARVRSPGYPNDGLQEAIDNARKIFQDDHRNPITRETAARHLGYAGVTGTSDRAMSAMMHFGLLARHSKGEIKVSDLAMEILFPPDDDSYLNAIRRAADSPDLFARIKEKFPEAQPSEMSLRNYLTREGFNSSAVAPAIKSYLDTQQFVRIEAASKSVGGRQLAVVESADVESKAERKQMLDAAPELPTRPSKDLDLNKVSVEINGDVVKISALLDRAGLDILEKKITALKSFLDD